ncbi:MAG: hypothetical protein ACYTCU_01250 [Planctomycetota bacterium]|jgi:hypothetical protein
MNTDIEKRLAAVEDALEDLQQQRAEEMARNRRASMIRVVALIVLGVIYIFYIRKGLSGL